MQGSKGDTDIENRLTQVWGTEREGYKERVNRETYTLPYIKQTANGNLLCDSGNSNQGSVIT